MRKNFIIIGVSFFITVFIFTSFLSTPKALAEVLGPGWFNGKGEQVTLEEADAYYGTKEASGTNTVFNITALAAPQAISAAISPEITELARGLKNDPKLIYEYVRNNIDYIPYFGSLKGAALTLMEGGGNDFDQASLMIELLRASGVSAQYVYVDMTIPNSSGQNNYDMDHWVGVGLNINFIQWILSGGGIPFTINATDTNMKRVIVKATINGADYWFDPAFKVYTNIQGAGNLLGISGYDKNALFVAAGGVSGTDYIRNINDNGLRAELLKYSNNLAAYLRNTLPNASTDEVISGRVITPEYITGLNAKMPFTKTINEYWDVIPDVYIHTVTIKHGTIDKTYKIPDIAGKKLSIVYNTGDIAELWLEDTLEANETAPGSSNAELIINVNHPYAANGGTYADQNTTYNLIRGGSTYAIVSEFGGGRWGRLLEARQKRLDTYKSQGLADSSREVLTETLNIIGHTWLQETDQSKNLINTISGTTTIAHHRFGIIAQEAGYYIDVKTQLSASVSIDGSDSAFLSSTFLWSAFEHGILEQLQGIDRPAASTVKLMHIANQQGGKIFMVNNANFSIIKPQLTNYTENDINDLQNQLNQGTNSFLILPDNGKIRLGEWEGRTNVSYSEKNGTRGFGMIIGGGYWGGYGGVMAPVYIPAIVNNYTPLMKTPINITHPVSNDPVDLYTGAYLFNQTDLSIGEAEPKGLHLSRSYNSNNSKTKGIMGYGWTYGYDIKVDIHSDVKSGLGFRSPMDAVSFLITSMIVNDLMEGTPALKDYVIGMLVSQWGMDQLFENAATIQVKDSSLTFIKLPDGSYSSPPGVTMKLIKEAGLYRLEERFGGRIEFNSAHKISLWKDVDQNTMTFTYDAGNNLQTVTDSFGLTLTFNYTGGFLSDVTDSSGRVVRYAYSGDNLTTYTDQGQKLWGYGYDTDHKMTTLKDPLNITTATNAYYSFGRVAVQTVPRQGGGNASYNFYYNGFNNIEEDPYGNKTIYYFNTKGLALGVEDGLGNKRTKRYDGQNHVIAEVDPFGMSTRYIYDGNHNITKVIDVMGKEVINTYDSKFRLTDIKDPLNNTVHYNYDLEHHLISTTDAEGNAATASYYPDGKPQSATDARGTATVFTYDLYGNPQITKTSTHQPVNYVYDQVGRMTSLTDNVGSATTFTYNTRGLLDRITDPLGMITGVSYDDAGRKISRTDRKGDITTYQYTPSSKLEKVTYKDLSTVAFSYDLHDKLKSMTDAAGTSNYTYDNANRLISSTDPNGFTISYTYDKAGNLTAVTYPGNKTVNYFYDNLNRLQAVDTWSYRTTIYTYDAASRLINVKNFNSTKTAYTYDRANRLKSLENRRADNSVISTYAFTLDANGNRTEIIQDEPLVPIVDSSSTAFTYNTQKNRLLTAGTAAFAYDNEGQLSNKDGTVYTFDFEHRLKTIGGTTTFTYDGKGNRIKAVRNGVTTKYIYDAAGNLIAEADAGNVITRYYVYGAGLLAMITPSGSVYNYHFNATGGVVAMTDSGQNIVNKYAYTPFGIIGNKVEAVPQPFTFVGQFGVMTEPEGIYYMRARYYDPEVGRFISEDPIGFGGGDLNLFGYVFNNPVMSVDPSGLEIRIYNRPAMGPIGWLGGNHAFLYSTETDTFEGMGGADEKRLGTIKNGSYNVVPNPNNVSEEDVMTYMKATKDSGIWFPIINDCHTKVDNTLTSFGLENPGAPGGRVGSIPSSPNNPSSGSLSGIISGTYGGKGK